MSTSLRSSNVLQGAPRLRNGHFVGRDCPECGGKLQPEGDGDWRCDGLIDPEDPRKELEACERAIVSGVLFPHTPTELACRSGDRSERQDE